MPPPLSPVPPAPPARRLAAVASLVALVTAAVLTLGATAAGAQSSGGPSTIPGGGSPTVVNDTQSSTIGTLMFVFVVLVVAVGAVLLYVRNRPARTSG